MSFPWTARRSNQSILKEINPEYSLERLILKLQYFGYLMRRADSLKKTLMLGKIEDRMRRGRERVRWLDGIINSMDMKKFEQTLGDSEGRGSLEYCSPWGDQKSDMTMQSNNNNCKFSPTQHSLSYESGIYKTRLE